MGTRIGTDFFEKSWYLLYSKPRLESIAEANLQRQGYITFLPLVRARRRRNNRYVVVTEPYFPRYLFIQLDRTTDNWGPIRSTIGVSHLVRFGERVATVPDAFVETLEARESNGVPQIEPRELKSGDRVRITEGVAQDYEGIIIATNARERVELLLATAEGYTANVQVPEAWLERVG